MNDKQEFVDITEVVYRGARKGRGLVVSPKGEYGRPREKALHALKSFFNGLPSRALKKLNAVLLRNDFVWTRRRSRVSCPSFT